MAEDRIRYEALVQESLRHVIRKVLTDVQKEGLPGEHHFFITFLTSAAGVQISAAIRERYPGQMTIVLQHQFWNLRVEDDFFEVMLSFGDIPEKLVIPFTAIQVFYDPAAAFEAAFDMPADRRQDEQRAESGFRDSPAAHLMRKPEESAAPDASDRQEDTEAGRPHADVVSLDAFRKNK